MDDSQTIVLGDLQTLRWKLYETAEARGSLTHPDVIAVSEEADRLILLLQRCRMKPAAAAFPQREGPKPGPLPPAQLTEESG